MTDVIQWAADISAASRAEFRRMIDFLPADEKARVGAINHWSAKDELTHLVFWLETFAANTLAQREGRALIDTRDYLRLNDEAWVERHDWSWEATESGLAAAFAQIERSIAGLTPEQFIDPAAFSWEAPRPFLYTLIYDLVDHPMLHFAGLYRRLAGQSELDAATQRMTDVLLRRGYASLTLYTRKKLRRYATA
jgi:hypothetical protein